MEEKIGSFTYAANSFIWYNSLGFKMIFLIAWRYIVLFNGKNACVKKYQKFRNTFGQKNLRLNKEFWAPVAPASTHSLTWAHHLLASLISDQRTSILDEARCSDSLQGISRNICSPCVAHWSELCSTCYHVKDLRSAFILNHLWISVNCGANWAGLNVSFYRSFT